MTSIVIIDKKGNKLTFCIDSYSLYLKHKWKITAGKYINRNIYVEDHRGFKVIPKTNFFHKTLLDCPVGYQVDHINGDRLDNRICNLRICTLKENSKNKKAKIYFDNKMAIRKWYHVVEGKYKYFQHREEAVTARNELTRSLYGQFARMVT